MSSIIASQFPSASAPTLPPELVPDLDQFVVQDDTPVDSLYAERLMRLLVSTLYTSWPRLYPQRKMLATANVGLFYSSEKDKPPVVPDVMVSLDIDPPRDVRVKQHRSYFAWIVGKMPDAVIEIVSNTQGEELGDKFGLYAHLGIPYYVVWDPEKHLGKKELYCFALHDKQYQDNGPWFPGIGLGVKTWQGDFEGLTNIWLRWCDQAGNLLLTADEQIAIERQRADRLAAQLRALGVEPQA